MKLSARRRTRTAAAAALLLAVCEPLAGQELSAAVGGALGAAGGALVSVAIVTAEARAGAYLYDTDDLGWRLVPIPIGMAAGAALGYGNGRRLADTALTGALGFWAGSTVGALVGGTIGRTAQDAWSGWIIGGAAGLIAGSLVGALRDEGGPSPGGGSVVQLALPLGSR